MSNELGMWPDAAPPPGTELTFVVQITRLPLMPPKENHYYVYFAVGAPGPWDIEVPFALSTSGNRLWRTESHAPSAGREASPVFGKEVTETDEWQADPPITCSGTFGALSQSGPGPATALDIQISFDQHKGQNHIKYAAVSDLQWDDGTVNFAPYHFGVPPPGVGVYLDGKAGGIDLTAKMGAGAWHRTVGHGRPRIIDFSVFAVRDRLAALLGTPKIDGPFQASLSHAASLGWDTTP